MKINDEVAHTMVQRVRSTTGPILLIANGKTVGTADSVTMHFPSVSPFAQVWQAPKGVTTNG